MGAFTISAVTFAILQSFDNKPAYAHQNSSAFTPIATKNSIEEGKIYEYIINDGIDRVAVAFVNGKYFCVSGFCPHFKAQLAAGVVDKATICCPWHGCRYCLKTGKLLEGPSMHDIQTFDVIVDEQGTLFVSVPKGATTSKIVPPPLLSKRSSDSRTFAIVGSGPAGVAAADSLRETGFMGRIILIGEETALPYDRTLLSKNLKAKVEKLSLRPQAHYEERGIELMLGKRADRIVDKTIYLSDGTKIPFDKVLIATGSKPKTLGLENEDVSNVVHLRSHEDVERLRSHIFKYCRAVVIGEGPVAAEAVSALTRMEASVTMVTNLDGPLNAEGGSRIRDSVAQILRDAGAKIIYNSTVSHLTTDGEGKEKRVRVIEMKDGSAIQADVIVVANGFTPTYPHLINHNDQGNEGKHLRADERLRLEGNKDFFVAGDVAAVPSRLMSLAFPSSSSSPPLLPLHCWTSAVDSGRAAARAMLSDELTLRAVGVMEPKEVELRLKSFATSHVPLYTSFIGTNAYRFVGLDGIALNEKIYPADLSAQKRPTVGKFGLPPPFSFVEGDAKKKFRFTAWTFRPGQDSILGAAFGGVDPAAVGLRELFLRDDLPAPASLILGVFNARQALNQLQMTACFGAKDKMSDTFSTILPNRGDVQFGEAKE